MKTSEDQTTLICMPMRNYKHTNNLSLPKARELSVKREMKWQYGSYLVQASHKFQDLVSLYISMQCKKDRVHCYPSLGLLYYSGDRATCDIFQHRQDMVKNSYSQCAISNVDDGFSWDRVIITFIKKEYLRGYETGHKTI